VGDSDGYYSRFWPRTGPRQPFAKSSVGVTSEGERVILLPLLCWLACRDSLPAFLFFFLLILLVVSSVTSLSISRAALHARRPRDNLPCCVNRKRARHRGVAVRRVTRSHAINRKRGCVVGCTKWEVWGQERLREREGGGEGEAQIRRCGWSNENENWEAGT
jgi:hypothetical protein